MHAPLANVRSQLQAVLTVRRLKGSKSSDPNCVQRTGGDAHLIEHAVQLIARLANTVAIVAVNHEDQALCVLEVVPPQWTDLRTGTSHVSSGSA